VFTTELGGVLTDDTVLDLAGSPYRLIDSVTVPADVHLTILPGVHVLGIGSVPLFVVLGTIDVIGSEDAPVVLDGNCVADFFFADNSAATARLNVEQALVQNGVSFWAIGGDEPRATFSLKNSRLQNVSRESYVWYPEADIFIEGNVFVRAAGFSVGHSDANVYVRNNRFVSFHEAVLTGDPESLGLFWVENWAAYDGSVTVVEQNAFLTVSHTALELPPGFEDTAIDGRNNYWGSESTDVIGSMITDALDGNEHATVIPFAPIATEIPVGVPED
jgi:hypothetical protein